MVLVSQVNAVANQTGITLIECTTNQQGIDYAMTIRTYTIMLFAGIIFCLVLGTAHAGQAIHENSTSLIILAENTPLPASDESTSSDVSETPANAPDTPESAEPQSMQSESSGTPEDTSQQTAVSQSKGEIARAQFTTAIQDREPTDDITTLSNSNDKVYFFTELVNFEGSTITHRWEYQGKTMAEVNIRVGSNRWRAYSSKSLKPDWTGTWTVTILDESGTTLKTSSFEYVSAGATQ